MVGPLPVIGMSFQIVHPKCRPPMSEDTPIVKMKFNHPSKNNMWSENMVYLCIPPTQSRIITKRIKRKAMPVLLAVFLKNVTCTCQPAS